MGNSVAVWIKKRMVESGLYQKAVAERAGFTEQQFSDMLNGRKVIRAEYLPAIANAMGVHVSDLFMDTAHPGA